MREFDLESAGGLAYAQTMKHTLLARRLSRRMAMLFCFASLISSTAMSGCTFKGGAREKPQAPVNLWEPRPVSIRLLPSTRFVFENGRPIMETGVEIFDDMGDTLKAPGRLRLELYLAGDTPGESVGRLLYSWDVNLITLADQQQYYSSVIRGYRLRLGMEDLEPRRVPTVLRATFEQIDGTRLTAQSSIRTDW